MASSSDPAQLFADMLKAQGEMAQQIMSQFLPAAEIPLPGEDVVKEWADSTQRLQAMWLDFQNQQVLPDQLPPLLADPAQWFGYLDEFYRHMPFANPEKQQELMGQGIGLWVDVMGQYGIGPKAKDDPSPEVELPLKDRRFADPRWREQPVFALIHQTYLMFSAKLLSSIDEVEGLEERDREQLRFATRTMLDAMSPANFPLINPVVLEKTIEQHGENLVKGM
jgi:polyhydroxyalkanoate synthase